MNTEFNFTDLNLSNGVKLENLKNSDSNTSNSCLNTDESKPNNFFQMNTLSSNRSLSITSSVQNHSQSNMNSSNKFDMNKSRFCKDSPKNRIDFKKNGNHHFMSTNKPHFISDQSNHIPSTVISVAPHTSHPSNDLNLTIYSNTTPHQSKPKLGQPSNNKMDPQIRYKDKQYEEHSNISSQTNGFYGQDTIKQDTLSNESNAFFNTFKQQHTRNTKIVYSEFDHDQKNVFGLGKEKVILEVNPNSKLSSKNHELIDFNISKEHSAKSPNAHSLLQNCDKMSLSYSTMLENFTKSKVINQNPLPTFDFKMRQNDQQYCKSPNKVDTSQMTLIYEDLPEFDSPDCQLKMKLKLRESPQSGSPCKNKNISRFGSDLKKKEIAKLDKHNKENEKISPRNIKINEYFHNLKQSVKECQSKRSSDDKITKEKSKLRKSKKSHNEKWSGSKHKRIKGKYLSQETNLMKTININSETDQLSEAEHKSTKYSSRNFNYNHNFESSETKNFRKSERRSSKYRYQPSRDYGSYNLSGKKEGSIPSSLRNNPKLGNKVYGESSSNSIKMFSKKVSKCDKLEQMNSKSKKRLFTKKENKNDIMNFQIINTTQSKFKIKDKQFSNHQPTNFITSQFNSKKIVKQISHKLLMSKKNLSQKELITNLASFQNIVRKEDDHIGKDINKLIQGPSMNSINLSIDLSPSAEIKRDRTKKKMNYRCIKIQVEEERPSLEDNNKGLCSKSSVINLFSNDEESLQIAKDRTKCERRNIINKIRHWKALYSRIFGQKYTRHHYEQQQLGDMSLKQQIYHNRGQLLFQREKDSEIILTQIECLKSKENVLSEISSFCDQWKDRKEVFLYFQLTNQKFDFYKINYNYLNSIDPVPSISVPKVLPICYI